MRDCQKRFELPIQQLPPLVWLQITLRTVNAWRPGGVFAFVQRVARPVIQKFLTGGGTPGSNGSNPSLEELLAFERLLSDLSASFAIVAGDRVVAEIESCAKAIARVSRL